jgi:DNA repair protein RadC
LGLRPLLFLKGGNRGGLRPTSANMQRNLFSGGDFIKTKGSYCWVSTRLVRESGPWYAEKIASPDDVARIMRDHIDIENLDREHFIVLHLSCKNNINAIQTVSIGGLHSSLVHPREVFKAAILTSSAAIILVHNHPSGDPTPSTEDINITRRIIEAGKILGIEVLDHVVIGLDRFASLKVLGQCRQRKNSLGSRGRGIKEVIRCLKENL